MSFKKLFHRWGKIRMLLPYQPDYKQDQLKVPGTGVCAAGTCNGQHSHQVTSLTVNVCEFFCTSLNNHTLIFFISLIKKKLNYFAYFSIKSVKKLAKNSWPFLHYLSISLFVLSFIFLPSLQYLPSLFFALSLSHIHSIWCYFAAAGNRWIVNTSNLLAQVSHFVIFGKTIIITENSIIVE
jgi:Domain of unknown function (DUF4808)